MRKIFFPSSKPRFVNEKEVVLEIKKLALKLAERNRKIKDVYLFGSYAQGDAGLYSDADVLIVLFEDKRRMIDRLDEFILGFVDAPVPVDVLVYTQDELERALGEQNRFLIKAVSGINLCK